MADTTLGWRLVNPRFKDLDGGKATISLGETAEEVAVLDGISREDSDAWGLRSQQLTAEHRERLALDFVAVETGKGEVDRRTRCRGRTPAPRRWPSSSPPSRPTASSPPAARRRSPTAPRRSSSPAREARGAPRPHPARADRGLGLGRRAAAHHGARPRPLDARRSSRARAGRSRDLDAVEINEAFATQVIASIRRLGLDPEIVNAYGGAIAVGHPLGASGVRLVLGLLRRLEDGDLRRGLATLCIGVGQGMALTVERV